MVAKIPDEADPDGDFVEAFAGEVAALDLFDPALPDLDLSVARIGSISNDEVVGHAIFHSALFVISVEDSCVATSGAAVVNDDIFPVAHVIASGVDLVAYGRQERGFGWGGRFGSGFWCGGGLGGGGWWRESKDFADGERVIVQMIPNAEIFD